MFTSVRRNKSKSSYSEKRKRSDVTSNNNRCVNE